MVPREDQTLLSGKGSVFGIPKGKKETKKAYIKYL